MSVFERGSQQCSMQLVEKKMIKEKRKKETKCIACESNDDLA